MTDSTRKILQGDVRALARAATDIENGETRAVQMLRELAPFGGNARVVGITGPPGAGKSTLVDALATAIRKEGKTLAILAVDPSSGLTGGAILGDRIRMQQHHADPGIFIRSMATRGCLGGIAPATAGVARLMDAAGKEYVLIETVGVGQAEIEIAALAQVTVVVLTPGMGDDVQALKAGIMEIADIFVINKSDLPGADRVEQELQAMLSLSVGRKPEIDRTVATNGVGIEELLAAIAQVKPSPKVALPRGITIDHIGIATQSIPLGMDIFDALGLQIAHLSNTRTEGVATVQLGDSQIQLLQATAPDSPIEEFVAKYGPGLHHLTLRVPDLDAAVERLRGRSIRILDERTDGAGGQRCVFVHPANTGGVMLELIQDPSRQPVALPPTQSGEIQ